MYDKIPKKITANLTNRTTIDVNCDVNQCQFVVFGNKNTGYALQKYI